MTRCAFCNVTDPLDGLTERQSYRGGVGYEWSIQCVDRVACCRRMDANALSDEMQAELERTRELRRVWA